MTIERGIGAVPASIYQATLAETGNSTAEITIDDVKRVLREGSAIVLDTRRRAQFEAGHIPGALNLDDGPLGEQVAWVDRLVDGNKSEPLVLYCNGPYCRRTRELAVELHDAGFTAISRFQLGIPVWRALGLPIVIELEAIKRIHGVDRTAVYFDARSADVFAKGSVPGAANVPVGDVIAGRDVAIPLPGHDFNTRIIVFGKDGNEARQLVNVLGMRPCHNVAYFAGTAEQLIEAVAKT